MKAKKEHVQTNSMLFGLTDQSVEYRNKWRGIANAAVWFFLSILNMVIMLFGSGAITLRNIAIIIGMSFIKYIPLLSVVYNRARDMAARYLNDVYELHDDDLASDFLEEVTFGYGREKIIINEGKISQKDEMSPLILIGGPGEIQVNLDSIALLEKVNGEPEVIYPHINPWKLGRFERIREIGKYDEAGKREYAIINLRDQFVSGLSVKSRTKDGIPIEAQDIKVIFSILRRAQTENDNSQIDAYSFDENAVQTLVYNQTIITPEQSTPTGITFPWDTTVIPLVTSELEGVIKSHNLSEILASISQKEMDSASSNDQALKQMRMEMTRQQMPAGTRKESSAPNFESRSRITAQFFGKEFQKKAAELGVAVIWIDIGTWQLPSALNVYEKHKEAWNLSRENTKKLGAVERSKKRHEMAEIIKLINSVVIANYDKGITRSLPYRSSREVSSKEYEKERLEFETFLAANPEYRGKFAQREVNRKDAISIAVEILKAFRKEMVAAQKSLMENDGTPLEEKQAELAKIDKALSDISFFTHHWVKKS